MIIIPAVDILGSKCVRLSMGNYDERKEYALSPVEAALNWQKQGAQRLHIVDLDGAKSGSIDNYRVIKEIIDAVNIPVEVGGGIRDDRTIEKYMEAGASFVILGSVLFKKINAVESSLVKYSGRIIAGMDLNEGKIAVSGWKEFVEAPFMQEAERLRDYYGIKTFIVTDIKKDGMLGGVNVDLISELEKLKVDIIASGGVSSIDDIAGLKMLGMKSLVGVITGKALYDGRLDLKEAIAMLDSH